MGLNVRRAKFIIIVAASLVTAAAVSFAGIIGFVGSDRSACGAHLVGRGLSPLDPAQHYRRRICFADRGCAGACRAGSAGIACWHCHGAGGRAVFSVGLAALEESRIMVKVC